jgi:hypothetical protein
MLNVKLHHARSSLLHQNTLIPGRYRRGSLHFRATWPSIAMVHTHLSAGHDVVPQYLGHLQFVLALEALADQVGVEFVETEGICTTSASMIAYPVAPGCPGC